MKPALWKIGFLSGMLVGFSGMAQKKAFPVVEELPPKIAPVEKSDVSKPSPPLEKVPLETPSTPLLRSMPWPYRVIVQRNLFRRLGWKPSAPQNPFTLIGIVDDGKRKRALLARQGSAMGIYATVGEEVGHGYKIAAIERYSVRLTGGPFGTLTCDLDRDVVGLTGGRSPAPSSTVPPKAPPSKSPPKRYYPVRGARLEDILREILEREGLSWEKVDNDKALQQKLKKKYQYLEEEGYVKFP